MKAAARFLGWLVRRLPISVRLGATFAMVFLAVLVAISGIAYWGLGQRLRSELDLSLVAAAQGLEPSGPGIDGLADEEIGGVQSPQFETQVIAADGRVVQGSKEDVQFRPVLSDEQVADVRQEGALFADVEDADGEAYRATAVPLEQPPGQVLVVMAELDS